MNRFACFGLVGISLVVACSSQAPEPASNAKPAILATAPDASTPADGGNVVCDQLIADAASALSTGMQAVEGCNVDDDCELTQASLDCVVSCGQFVVAKASEGAFKSLVSQIEGDQCAAMTAHGCHMDLPYCPFFAEPGLTCLNHSCVGRQLMDQSDGGATGDGTTCTWDGSSTTYAIGTKMPSPNGCSDCLCTGTGFACAGCP